MDPSKNRRIDSPLGALSFEILFPQRLRQQAKRLLPEQTRPRFLECRRAGIARKNLDRLIRPSRLHERHRDRARFLARRARRAPDTKRACPALKPFWHNSFHERLDLAELSPKIGFLHR